MHRFLLIILLLVFVLSLRAETGPQVYKDTLSINGFPESTYGIYIPSVSDYNELKAVIYLFGDLRNNTPLIHEYISLAKEFSMALVYIHPTSIHLSVTERFSSINGQLKAWLKGVEPDIYVAGHNESASEAFQVAVANKEVRGMIGINLPDYTVEEVKNEYRRDLDFIHVAGNRSSSFYYMSALKKYFKTYRLNYKGIVLSGRNHWPETDEFWEILDWIKFENARKTPGSNVKYMARRFEADFGSAMISEKKQPVIAYDQYLEILVDYDDLFNTEAVESRMNVLENSKKHQQKFREAEKFERIEKSKIHKYEWTLKQYRVMTLDTNIQKPLDWWEEEVDELRRLTRSKNDYKSLMASRLLDYLSRESENYFNEYILKMDYYMALKMNKIWLYINPNEYLGYYHRAKLYALQFQEEQTLTYLKRASDLGFNNLDISREDSFQFLIGNYKYHQIVNAINSKR